MTVNRAIELLRAIICKPYELSIYAPPNVGYLAFRISVNVPDLETGRLGPLMVGHHLTFDFIEAVDEKALLHFALREIEKMACHEIREWFTVEGERVFNPHKEAV